MKKRSLKIWKKIAVLSYILACFTPVTGNFEDAFWGIQCLIIGAIFIKSIFNEGVIIFLCWLPNLLFLGSLIFRKRIFRLILTGLAVILSGLFLILLAGDRPGIGFYLWDLSFIIWGIANWRLKHQEI